MVKVKVELVCDMHFPGWCAKLEAGRGEGKNKTYSLHPSGTTTGDTIQRSPRQMQEAMSYLVSWTWARKVKRVCSEWNTATGLSIGLQSIKFQLPAHSRQGPSSEF